MSSPSPSQRRVVITGLGLITPLGLSPDELWDALVNGRSGVTPMADDTLGLTVHQASVARQFSGEVADFGPLEGEKKKAIRKGLKLMCRESQMGVAAAQRALHHAGLSEGQTDPERTGVVYGSDYMVTDPEEFAAGIRQCVANGNPFQFSSWPVAGLPQMSPLWLLKYLPNMPASHIAIYNDLRGPNNSLTQREAAGVLAVGEAFRIIARGHADIMIAGATGTRVHPMKAVHASLQEPLADGSKPAAEASRPFDLHRTGMVLGEGAGAVVLEELGAAQARGATILGEVVGFGSAAVADRKLVARRGDALEVAFRAALRDAGMAPREIGHIQAHGLSTRTGDVEEAQAIRRVLEGDADRVPVTAAKSYFGNLGAGSGVVELIAGVLALGAGRLFPVLNYRTRDPECPIHVVNEGDAGAGECFAKLSVTPQGQSSCVIVRRFS